ncbi:MAG TPA: hypothetical protein VG817_05140 [Gemmatimonadales bacterium]|nr:hypothetical protein [Gemmatimonadales bacterium]
MHCRTAGLALVALAAAVSPAAAQHDHSHGDNAFAALQQRGAVYMGVDQYTSVHEFEDLPDGGRIRLARDPGDSAGVATIRAHLQEIARAFTAGDFEIPMLVHDAHVPGTDVMASRHDRIEYTYQDVSGGGEIRIRTADPMALSAIRGFLAFQRDEHHTLHTH